MFPTSVHVNPQLTVMGMAQYAAGRILGRDLPIGATPVLHSRMPTKHRRHAITETPPVRAALDELRDELGDGRIEFCEL